MKIIIEDNNENIMREIENQFSLIVYGNYLEDPEDAENMMSYVEACCTMNGVSDDNKQEVLCLLMKRAIILFKQIVMSDHSLQKDFDSILGKINSGLGFH